MKNKKILITLAALSALGVMSASTFAFGGPRGGQGQGSGQNYASGSTGQCADTNNNGICDGQEDWDNDGVVNSQDSDFDKQYVNQSDRMQDTNNNGIPDGQEDFDGDGVPNNQDEDYKTYQNAPANGQLQSNQYKGANKGGVNAQGVNATQTGTGSMGANAQKNMNNVSTRTQSMQSNTEAIKMKLGTKTTGEIDTVLDNFYSKLSGLSEEDQITKIQSILDRINAAYTKVQAITDETKKEFLTNVLDYLKVSLEDKLAELQGTTTTTDDGVDLIGDLLGN